jgi:hypothetical protein
VPDYDPAVSVGQAKWATRRLSAARYLFTRGLTACTGFALVYAPSKVVALAHFDTSSTPHKVNTMFEEMIHLGATAANIRCVIAGDKGLNMTALGVYNDLLASNYPTTAVTVYDSRGELAVFGDGTVCRFSTGETCILL